MLGQGRKRLVTLKQSIQRDKIHVLPMFSKLNEKGSITVHLYRPLGYEMCTYHFVKWQIHPFISKGTISPVNRLKKWP